MAFDNTGVILSPGWDTSKMSDEEIQEKLNDLNHKMIYAYSTFGHQSEMIMQLRNLQNILRFEQTERMSKEMAAVMINNSSKILETEPDLQVHETKKDMQSKSKSDTQKRTIPVILKTWLKDKNNK